MHYNITSKQLAEEVKSILMQEHSKNLNEATYEDIYKATAYCVRRMLSRKNKEFMADTYGQGKKKVYYLCIEFLMGRSLKTNLYNMGLDKVAADMFKEFGVSEEKIYECEPDAGLGNGGLGRLAACFMDALASDQYAGGGYSILYEYGIFKQKIVNGWQQEQPDNWLPGGEVWLKAHPNQAVEVKFGGTAESIWTEGFHHVVHNDYSSVMAIPYDMYVSGYGSKGVSKLRLWESKAKSIDMDSFNKGDYLQAIKAGSDAELISKVLYPNDNHTEGKILRLKQQYFFCCASINDIVTNHLAQYGTLENLAEKVAIHINDTHPTLSIPELMRILLDECGYGWDNAWAIVTKAAAYTNHTVMKEALECWPEDLFRSLLPRIHQIVKEIDNRYRAHIWEQTHDAGKVEAMAVISGGVVRMANLCVATCHSVNGVSALHSQILKDTVFNDFYRLTPDKFKNVTNGIAHRRWLCQANPGLTEYLSKLIGNDFILEGDALKKLREYADDEKVLADIEKIKFENKKRFAAHIKKVQGIELDPNSIFDVQVKRLHEYKRQHLNALNILAKYLEIKENPGGNYVPHTYIFGAKAAPGYFVAKKIISFIIALADMINNDPDVNKFMKVVYVEDYNVTMAEMLMPAADISEQISLAGTEASGTGNMKLMINGAVTLGTMDGANVEIYESVGEDNIIIFGMSTPEVEQLKKAGYNPTNYYHNNQELHRAIDFINNNGINGKSFPEIGATIIHHDPYMVLADFADYRNAQKKAEALFLDRKTWNRMSLMNTAGAGIFAADRSINDYARDIWHTGSAKGKK